MPSRRLFILLLAVALAGAGHPAQFARAEQPFITVQSTTSTENSGLFKYLLPIFSKKSGIEVRVVAVGTGQAIKNAQNGDGDVLLVHAQADEEKFVAEGYGVKRFDVMYNDFIILGPSTDSAKVSGTADPIAALKAILESKAPFISRGDDSGTHKAELKLWKDAGIDIKAQKPEWYREAGQGMGAALNMAAETNAYVLSDRASWSAFKNKRDLKVAVQGDKRLFNPYGVILVNPEKHPRVRAKEGQAFVNWLISDEGQAAIAAFKIEGEQQFFPAAKAAKATN